MSGFPGCLKQALRGWALSPPLSGLPLLLIGDLIAWGPIRASAACEEADGGLSPWNTGHGAGRSRAGGGEGRQGSMLGRGP